MPKVKTNSGAKKRFVLTGTGKVKRHHAYHSHILTKKTKKQKRNLDHSALVVSQDMKQVRACANLTFFRVKTKFSLKLLTECLAQKIAP